MRVISLEPWKSTQVPYNGDSNKKVKDEAWQHAANELIEDFEGLCWLENVEHGKFKYYLINLLLEIMALPRPIIAYAEFYC